MLGGFSEKNHCGVINVCIRQNNTNRDVFFQFKIKDIIQLIINGWYFIRKLMLFLC